MCALGEVVSTFYMGALEMLEDAELCHQGFSRVVIPCLSDDSLIISCPAFITVSLLSSVQFSRSVMSDSLQPYGLQPTRLPFLSPPLSLFKLMSIESVIPSHHLILCHPLLLLPRVFPSIRVFSNESVLRIRWPKDWSFSFNISPSSEYSGLISFRMD